jgi:DnaJ-class molecular chaperone
MKKETEVKKTKAQCAIQNVSVAKRTVCKPCNGTGGNSGLGVAYFKCVHCNGTGLQTER